MEFFRCGPYVAPIELKNDEPPTNRRSNFFDPRATARGSFDDVITVSGAAGPKNNVRIPGKNLSLDTVQELRTKARHLYIYGHIEYDDTFKNTPHHVTDYCFELTSIRGADFRAPPVIGNFVAFDFPACHKHNCTDDACKGQP